MTAEFIDTADEVLIANLGAITTMPDDVIMKLTMSNLKSSVGRVWRCSISDGHSKGMYGRSVSFAGATPHIAVHRAMISYMAPDMLEEEE